MKSRGLTLNNKSRSDQRPAVAGGGPSLVAPPASNVMPLKSIALALGVHRSTVQDWIEAGCPVVRLGEVGRGRGALLDLVAVRAWLVAQWVPGLAREAQADILAIAETAILDALKRDDLPKRAHVTEAQAQFILVLFYDRLYRNVKQEPLTREQIPEQMKSLCAICIESLQQANFQRR